MVLSLLAALAASAFPTGAVGEPPQVVSEVSAPAATAREGHPFLGVAVDAAFPDGLGASLLVMPLPWLRLEVGGLSNGIGVGVRGGATLVAFPRWAFRPLLSVEAGYVWGGHGMWALEYVADPAVRTALSDVSVGYAAARVGFELGSRHVALNVQAGASYLDASLGAQSLDFGGGVSLQAVGSRLRGIVPSVRVGFLFCFG